MMDVFTMINMWPLPGLSGKRSSCQDKGTGLAVPCLAEILCFPDPTNPQGFWGARAQEGL